MLKSVVITYLALLVQIRYITCENLNPSSSLKSLKIEKDEINSEDMIIKFLQDDSYQNEVLSSNSTDKISNILSNANDSTSDEIIALIKKKKKLIPKWQLSAGVYLEHKVNKKLLKNKLKDFSMMSISNSTDIDHSNGKKSLESYKNGDGVESNESPDDSSVVHRIPSSAIVSRASPNTRNLFAENITDYVKLFDGDTDGIMNNVTLKYQKHHGTKSEGIISGYGKEFGASENNCSSIQLPSEYFWTVLLAVLCFL
ncbi:uncharacterized protein KGF55_001700 [Candida pseudojiufengensis]|uniref:uncharacterized protein n=1 Tax=Candida pseudojiufengensis TaxID=497109 RepID=UPI00222548DF|nr:uncharacterized protein KGF55_001700 [Candida pseudojiufengensis]KAI5964631.1 hypothetical protein KGF55_001700 [Candida pseudojiufengensis]